MILEPYTAPNQNSVRRMAQIDAMPKEYREVFHEYGAEWNAALKALEGVRLTPDKIRKYCERLQRSRDGYKV